MKGKCGVRALILGVACLVLGCAAPTPEDDPGKTPETAATLIKQPSVTAANLDIRVDTAREILARRFDIGLETIRVVTAERVTWPNGAAGCPRKGAMYTQALVVGYRVVLAVDGREYHYHGRAGADPFYCAVPGPRSGWIQDR